MKKRTNQFFKIHVKKGDKVSILSGNHKGKEGVIIKVLPKLYRAVVGGVNLIHKHVKSSAKNAKGTIVEREAPMHISNLMIIDPTNDRPTRIGRRLNEEGKLQRYFKKSGNFVKNG